ncbi:phage baseplate assembly protein domain-containing protein [Novacetimonas hansenii]|uniref:Bacteriophage Mu Gp45 N-terminal domain-containing protein n=1 Tax=Novacetimonas hansenii TaxID=436 RepID=A0ABQ0SGT7_NOVHA|nr:phage baseplate assembly protein [Novacetimonas hansenii]GAN84020.1 hypothetical protein Gaha_0122_020 [Novacetimonas hansenii JCM 7643]GBQ55780.1 hypothetical protein AA0243_1008 [Novacetimonas hansenii NRIC 0243]GEC64600.1 hypothetical protein GHA01_24490 [Novacetimonas hansenii]
MERSIQELNNRVTHLVKTGTISNKIVTNGTIHTVQVSQFNGYEVHNNVPMYGTWGVTSTPPVGSQIITLSGYGAGNNKFVIATHDVNTHPQKMSQGETQIYDANKQSLYLSVNGIIITAQNEYEIKLGDNTIFTINKDGISIDANVSITGALKVSDSITATGDVTGNNISLSSHIHSVTAAPGETGAPQ